MDSSKKLLIATVGILAVGGLGIGVSAHNVARAEYARVCKSNSTGRRLEDKDCEDDDSSSSHISTGGRWYYVSSSRDQKKTNQPGSDRFPGVGDTLSGGSDTKPSDGTIYTGLPKEGGTFTDTYKAATAYEKVSHGSTSKSGQGGSSAGRGGFGGGHSTGGGHGG